MDWQPIETAPKDGTEVQLRTLGGFELRGSWTNGLVGHDEEDAGGWCAAEGEEYPSCWTDGVCWAVNEDLMQSDAPTHWMPTETETRNG